MASQNATEEQHVGEERGRDGWMKDEKGSGIGNSACG